MPLASVMSVKQVFQQIPHELRFITFYPSLLTASQHGQCKLDQKDRVSLRICCHGAISLLCIFQVVNEATSDLENN